MLTLNLIQYFQKFGGRVEPTVTTTAALRNELPPTIILVHTSQSLSFMTSSRSAQKLSRKILLWITEISANAALTYRNPPKKHQNPLNWFTEINIIKKKQRWQDDNLRTKKTHQKNLEVASNFFGIRIDAILSSDSHFIYWKLFGQLCNGPEKQTSKMKKQHCSPPFRGKRACMLCRKTVGNTQDTPAKKNIYIYIYLSRCVEQSTTL